MFNFVYFIITAISSMMKNIKHIKLAQLWEKIELVHGYSAVEIRGRVESNSNLFGLNYLFTIENLNFVAILGIKVKNFIISISFYEALLTGKSTLKLYGKSGHLSFLFKF